MAVVNENGKIAISNYEVIDEGKNHSLVKVRIETGRTHQIRVHMKHLNHPIMGDTTYGNGNDGADRQMLHAYRLKFIHPTKNTEMTVIAPLPEDFKRAAKHVGVDISKIESEIKMENNLLYQFDLEKGKEIIGVDEAGRGPLAGSVVAAAVKLKRYSEELQEINDSKKLTEKKREKLFDIIMENFEVGIGIASVQEIDELNILNATFLAMRRAIEELDKKLIQMY